MTELHWFPIFAEKWLASTAISMMLPEQEGAYFRLLVHAWAAGHGEPSLPADDASLSKLSRLGTRWKKLGADIRAQFTERDGRLYNAKLSEVWDEAQQKHANAVERGAKGGRKKAAKAQNGSSSATAKLEQLQQQPDSNNDERTDPVVDGVTPTLVAVWCNTGITERWGEQPSPLTPGQAAQLAADVTEAGVSAELVRDGILLQCQSSRNSQPPKHPNYFRAGIIEHRDRSTARGDLAASGSIPRPTIIRPFPLPQSTPRPTKQERSRAALAAWAAEESNGE